MPYRHIDAHDVLALLIEYGVEGYGGLARLSVPDDEFALTSAYGEESVHDEQPRLHGLVDGLTVDYAGRGTLYGAVALRGDIAARVHGFAQRVDHSAEESVSHGDARGLARAVDRAARLDVAAVAEHDDAAHIGTQILHHAAHSALEHDYLAVRGVLRSVRRHYAVADGKHPSALCGKHLRRPFVHGFAYERDDVALGKSECGEPVFQLRQPTLRAPIVKIAVDFQPETAGIGVAALPHQLRIAVFFREKTHETRKLRVRGTGSGIEDRFNLCHLSFPFRRRRGTPRKPRPRHWKCRLFPRSSLLCRGCRRPLCPRCGHAL